MTVFRAKVEKKGFENVLMIYVRAKKCNFKSVSKKN